jgi:hypothetical protein
MWQRKKTQEMLWRIMLNLFTILFKTDLDNLPSAESLYKEINRLYRRGDEVCATGKVKGTHKAHGKYQRNLIDFINNSIQESRVDILRLFCTSTGKTHCVLPDIFVPHKTYSIIFILKALKDYYFRQRNGETVEDVCTRCGIAVSTIYAWKKRYLTHKTLSLGKAEKYFHEMDAHLREP